MQFICKRMIEIENCSYSYLCNGTIFVVVVVFVCLFVRFFLGGVTFFNFYSKFLTVKTIFWALYKVLRIQMLKIHT